MKKQELFTRLTIDLTQKEGITEQLKAIDQMKWVQQLHNIREITNETISRSIIYN